jgi:hypothetical protein
MVFTDPIPRPNPNILPLPVEVKKLLPELGSLMARQNLTTADVLTNFPPGHYGYLLPRIIGALEQVTIVNGQEFTDAVRGREYDFVVGAKSKQSPIEALLIKGTNLEISADDVEIMDQFINQFPDSEATVIHYHPSGFLIGRSRGLFSSADIYNQIKTGVKLCTKVLVTHHSDRLWIIRPVGGWTESNKQHVSLSQIPEVDNPNNKEQLKLLSKFLFTHGFFLYSCSLDDRERKLKLITV